MRNPSGGKMEKVNTKWLVRMGALIAVIVLMSFTPLGYLKIGAVEITFIIIPVTIGAITMGPVSGLILGAAFGATSFIQCFGASPFGATLLGINWIYTLIMCMIPRMLMGWLTGVIFNAVHKRDKTKGKALSFSVASLAAPLMNTLFFVGCIILLFGSSDYIMGMRGELNLIAFFVAFVGLNGAIEAAVSFILGGAVSKAIYRYVKR